MNNNEKMEKSAQIKKKEIGKMILFSILWVVLLILSFLTYYAIPAAIFVTWMIIAWAIKAFKKDTGKGSGYDREF